MVPRKLSEAFAPYWGGGFFYFQVVIAGSHPYLQFFAALPAFIGKRKGRVERISGSLIIAAYHRQGERK